MRFGMDVVEVNHKKELQILKAVSTTTSKCIKEIVKENTIYRDSDLDYY